MVKLPKDIPGCPRPLHRAQAQPRMGVLPYPPLRARSGSGSAPRGSGRGCARPGRGISRLPVLALFVACRLPRKHQTWPAALCFQDESGQGLRPPKGRTWGRHGHTPVVTVTGVQGIWSSMKRSLANLTKQNIDQLTVLVKARPRRMQYRPGLLDGFLAKTRLDLSNPRY